MRRLPIALLLTIAACSTPPDLHVRSPNGALDASVRNHWSIDPPAQSLWLDDTRIATLGEDVDWCNTIVWSSDGGTAGYLVQDAKLIAVDAATRRIVSTQWLVARDGYPTSQEVRELQIDGKVARFKRCQRRGSECSDAVETQIR